MTFIKRALLSLKRRKLKPFLLFLILFVLGNTIAGATAIKLGTENAERTIKQSMGTVVSINMDHEAYQEALNNDPDTPYPEAIPAETLEKLGQHSAVKSYDFSAGLSVGSETLQAWHGDKGSITYVDGGNYFTFSLKGTQNPAMLLLEEDKASLTSGRTFTQEEVSNGSHVAMMPKVLAEKNQLSVGDSILLTNYIIHWKNGQTPTELDRRDIPLEIIGIFEEQHPDLSEAFPELIGVSAQIWTSNTVYVPNQVIINERIAANEIYIATMGDQVEQDYLDLATKDYYTNLYVLNDPADLEKFVRMAESLLPDFYIVKTNSAPYDLISAPVNQISKMTTYVQWVAIGATILIIGLVVMLFLRERKQEFGVYLSLGASRLNIIGQVLTEVLIVAILAFALSAFTGNLIASNLSNAMIQDQLVAETEDYMPQINTYFADELTFGSFASVVKKEAIQENYSIQLDVQYIAWFFVIGIGAVIVSSLLPTLFILRLNPKKIMM